MMIDAKDLGYKELNEMIHLGEENITLNNCNGQRFIATGMKDKNIDIKGVPGNALGAFLNGAKITVWANAQDAVADTMNEGEIIIHGSIGDTAGYAMRGGKLFVRDNAGYRTGIHMKAYKDKKPVVVIGGKAGSFLGEYQAGGTIIVLGLNPSNRPIVGDFPCTGMHGGKMLFRSNCNDVIFPDQVSIKKASLEDMIEFKEDIQHYCELFNQNFDEIFNSDFTIVVPNTKNPYKQLYVEN